MDQLNLNEFVHRISKLEPIEFLGLAKLFGAPLIKDNDEPADFEDILSFIINRYCELSRKKRKEILKMLKQANNRRG